MNEFIPQPDLPALAAAYEQLRKRPPVGTFTPEKLKAIRSMPIPPVQTLRPIESANVAGPRGPIPVRIIRPQGAVEAVLISVHAGGWCMGSAAMNDWLNEILAQRCGVLSVAIDYRLAPENPYPAGLDDVMAVAEWLGEVAQAEFGTERLLVSGSSAGAHLSSQLLLRLRDTRRDLLQRVRAVALSYGCYDISMTPSVRSAPEDALFVKLDVHKQLLDFAFPGLDSEARRSPSVSPLFADLKGLPPALFAAAGIDPMLDDTLFMATRWKAAGNAALLDVWPGCSHLFDTLEPVTGRAYAERLASWFNAHLAVQDHGQL